MRVRVAGAAAAVVAAGVVVAGVVVASGGSQRVLENGTPGIIDRRSKMLYSVSHRNGIARSFFSLTMSLGLLLFLTACNQQGQHASEQAAPKTFASPADAGKALADAAKSQSQDTILVILGPGSADVISSGDAAEDKASLAGFAQAYQVMNRWRKLGDGSELLLVGADNQAFPIPLTKNAAGQWYFDVAAGKKELLARRIGRNEIAAIYACGALAQSQFQYFSYKHDGVKQYAQKFISDPGQQNGLYWESAQSAPRSPLGPHVAFASDEETTIKPDKAQPFYGYYFRQPENQGPGAKGGAKPYLVDGKMTGGFAYVAYPAKYGDTGIQTFIINQEGVVFEKDLGKDTVNVAKTMTGFNPDKTCTELK
jgi:hypothetical protein